MKNKFYLTTAIPYVNAKPHIGFALEAVQADCLARYYRGQGYDVYFLTGSDENSLKNVQAAEKEGISVKELVKRNSKAFEDLKKILNLSYDQFIRTSEKRHFVGAQKLWSACKKEDIYKKKYKGLYCVGCEEFKRESDLVDGKCLEHQTKPEVVEEENYFFKLSNYQKELVKLVELDKLKIVPETRKNEVLSFIKSGLEDFSISRSKARAKNWGVPVPGDPEQVMYVWFDALANYITALGYGETNIHPAGGTRFQKYWPADLHVIGKGILRFHAVYWPAMLLSAGIDLPKEIFVHGYLTIEGKKISKSLGNVIDPIEVVNKYGSTHSKYSGQASSPQAGTDALRYYLLREVSSFGDGDFSWKRFEEIYNTELANELGNLVNRVILMIDKFQIPPLDYARGKKSKLQKDTLEVEVDEGLLRGGNGQKIDKLIENFQFNGALKEIWKDVHRANEYIEETKPWELAKSDKEKLEEVIKDLAYRISHIAYRLEPFLPNTAEKIQTQIRTLKPEVLFPRL